ncbi:MAG: NADH-quinone oxidoreductase subunit NuoF [Candidatus Omnitrophica bacterium]|nr:NADH-quinone oxidoreductase subunit NuoF [Candidatus Omnitrophota bacterium]
MAVEKLISRFFKIPNATSLPVYLAEGGYEAAKLALRNRKPEEIEGEVKRSHLRGLGGAGFSCGVKWSFVPRDTGKPIYLVVNADEGEPGTFKDKYILTYVPHLLIEGMIIASYAVGIHKAFIYIRGEYEMPYLKLKEAVGEAYQKGFLGENIFGTKFDLDIVIHRGAGAYICGEETGLLESLEGKKGFPRLKPPFPAVVGLFGCPTVINNVETLSYLPFIVQRGSEWFAKLGTERNGGMRLFSVSGHVKRPGIYELPMGILLRSIIYEHAGGISEDRKLKAVVPGGLSAAVLTADEIDVKMDFDSLKAVGSMGGSGGVIVMDETTSMVDALRVTMQFFAHESCGQCSPCREGTGWIDRILKRIVAGKGRADDVDHLLDIGKYLGGTTICALADGAQMTFLSYLKKFRKEFEDFIRNSSLRANAGWSSGGRPLGLPAPDGRSGTVSEAISGIASAGRLKAPSSQ